MVKIASIDGSSAPTAAVESPFYKKEELAQLFRVSERTIEKWTATGRLPAPRKIGKKWTAWVKAEVDALIADTWGKGGQP